MKDRSDRKHRKDRIHRYRKDNNERKDMKDKRGGAPWHQINLVTFTAGARKVPETKRHLLLRWMLQKMPITPAVNVTTVVELQELHRGDKKNFGRKSKNVSFNWAIIGENGTKSTSCAWLILEDAGLARRRGRTVTWRWWRWIAAVIILISFTGVRHSPGSISALAEHDWGETCSSVTITL